MVVKIRFDWTWPLMELFLTVSDRLVVSLQHLKWVLG